MTRTEKLVAAGKDYLIYRDLSLDVYTVYKLTQSKEEVKTYNQFWKGEKKDLAKLLSIVRDIKSLRSSVSRLIVGYGLEDLISKIYSHGELVLFNPLTDYSEALYEMTIEEKRVYILFHRSPRLNRPLSIEEIVWIGEDLRSLSYSIKVSDRLETFLTVYSSFMKEKLSEV